MLNLWELFCDDREIALAAISYLHEAVNDVGTNDDFTEILFEWGTVPRAMDALGRYVQV